MSGLGYAISDTLVLAKRSLLRIPRAPDLLLAFTVQPIMFVLLFAYVFGGAIEIMLVAMSAMVRPARTAPRDIGSERKRSIRPFLRSSESPRAVTKPPNDIVWTRIPGIRKSM